MRYQNIAIEREYASGGSEIGEKLAAKLGIPCYGQEILERAAEKLDMRPQQLIEIEEKTTSSLLFGLAAYANVSSSNEADMLRIEQKLALVEADVIQNLSVNSCVLVGRRAAALLRSKNSTLRVFIHADLGARMERAVSVYGADRKQAEAILHRHDKRRANYFKAATEKAWKDPDIYHMFLNSGILGIDQTVSLLYSAVH